MKLAEEDSAMAQLAHGAAQWLHRVGDAQQGERGAVEIQRRDRDQPEQRAEQQHLAQARQHHIRGVLHRGGDIEPRGCGGGQGADQHHPGAADERTEVGPPERLAHPDIARQVARVVRHVDRPAELVGGGGEHLREEGHGAKAAELPLRGGHLQQVQRAEGEQRQDRNHQVGEGALC
jgi:hypothetical protein